MNKEMSRAQDVTERFTSSMFFYSPFGLFGKIYSYGPFGFASIVWN